MSRKTSLEFAVILSLFVLCAAPLYGQANFVVSSASAVGADIGAAELTGNVVFTVQSGTTSAAPLQITYSATITNSAASEISVSGTGALAAVATAPDLNRSINALIINVPAGGVAGNKIVIAGVRVSLQGLNTYRVTASITSSAAGGNAIAAGQNVITVIESILSPFSVTLDSNQINWDNGQMINPATTISIREGFVTAFSSDIGNYGQSVATQIRFTPFPSVPPGVKLTFPSTVGARETTGTLTTLSGVPETVPRDDGTTSVTYVFNGVAAGLGTPGSSTTTESFPVAVTAALSSAATTGNVTFQATLLPIGITTPTASLPSTAIPRYSERTLPDETDLITGTTDLALPFRAQAEGTYTGIALTNPQNFRVKATLTAYDSGGNLVAGQNIANPVTLVLPRQGQVAKVATEVFGNGFNANAAGTIRVQGKTSILPGFYLIGDTNGSRLDGATADLALALSWTWPAVFHQGPSATTILEIFNPGTTTANVTFKLYNSAGVLLTTGAVQVAPNGSIASNISTLFAGLDVNSFSGGYIQGKSDVQVVPRETFGNALDNNVLSLQSGAQRTTWQVAHFASGGGYTTEINFLNSNPSVPAQITLSATDNNGTLFPIANNPKFISIPPNSQLIQGVQDLFPGLGSGLSTGYLRVDVTPYNLGPFTTTPILLGFVRFSASNGYASASLPLYLPPYTDFVYSHVAQDLGYFTGVTLLNPNAAIAEVRLEVYDKNGTLVSFYLTSLAPGKKLAKLIYEMVPGSLGQIGGYIRVRSNLPISSFALFGTDNGQSLSAIPPQPLN